MPITVHHRPIDPNLKPALHIWDDRSNWDLDGRPAAEGLDYALPDAADPRRLQFLFRTTDPNTHREVWERNDFARRIWVAAPRDIWSFEYTGRVLYQPPAPVGATFHSGDVLTFNVITQNRFKGGRLYAWNPYDPTNPSAFFAESSRADPVSTFIVRLAQWMIGGFHFKLVGPGAGGIDWEPDSANRVWRPSDGNTPWVKSGQVSVRPKPLILTSAPVEFLYPASLGSPPSLDLADPVEDFHQTLTPADAPFAASPLFRVARCAASVYPRAAYTLEVLSGAETPPAVRPFPADPVSPTAVSRFILGDARWVPAFPAVAQSVTLRIDPRPQSSFSGGVTVEVGVGAGPAHDAVPAVRRPDGSWQAALSVVEGARQWVRLAPAAGNEYRPYDWIDTRRFFTPPAAATIYYTREGVYGLTSRGRTPVADPPDRATLMRAAFGAPAVVANVFGADEMPHGATAVGSDVYFILHAPHAAWAALVLVDETAPGGPTRRQVPMALTGDTFYWWCKVPVADAPSDARYRFALNDDQEVMDPAARQVLDRGNFQTAPGDSPADPNTSWSQVADVAGLRIVATAQPWQTMGWDALLMYELHPKRFTDVNPGTLAPLDLVADELSPMSRRGAPGYLRQLPITALQLMPLHEFKSTASWGYNPAFFFAIDGNYGGATALARLVNAAHATGRGVLLDLVYNHMNDSPLTQVAPDVYSNGNAWGDRINNAHPMVKEFFRQATVYLWRTFGLDGFRFDSTTTVVQNSGWDFLGSIRAAVRTAASAEGRNWPYFVGENDPKFWDITDPSWGVMDGQWDIAEVYDVGHAAYDPWQPADDHAATVKSDMEVPETWGGRSFAEATRFGESHDSVSGQDPGNKRIAARPPYRQGLQMAKAVAAATLLSNGVPMLFMGQEVGETRYFSFDNDGPATNPQVHDLPPPTATDNTRVLAWFRALTGLRNDPAKGLRGNDNLQAVRIGRRTVAFTCGTGQLLFVVATFGTEDQRQDTSWLGLPNGGAYKEIFNSSWPSFQVEFEQEQSNGGYDAQIQSGQTVNLPHIGAVVLERR